MNGTAHGPVPTVAAEGLRRQGHPVFAAEGRDGHNVTSWRDTFHPHLTELLAELWATGHDTGGQR